MLIKKKHGYLGHKFHGFSRISLNLIILLILFLAGCNEKLTNKKTIPEGLGLDKMGLNQEMILSPNESVVRISRGWIYISWSEFNQDNPEIEYVIFLSAKRD